MTISPDMLVKALGRDFLAWWEAYGCIQDVYGNYIQPRSNYLQKQIYEVWLYCKENKLPCRIIVLKPRQKGSSTISTGMLYHTLCCQSANAAVIGGAYDQGAVLWRKLQTYEQRDKYPWEKGKGKIDEEKGKWPHGSYLCLATAKNKFAGVASTNQFLLITELAKWAREGVADAAHVLSEILKTVHDVEGTTIIIESTAFGANGAYYEHWQGAVTFEEFKELKSGYVKVFAPWFAFADSRISPAWDRNRIDNMIAELRIEPHEIEEYVEQWGLDDEQLSWMLFTIKDKCEKDFEIFKQDYPSDDETAFRKSGRNRFNGAGVRYLKTLVKKQNPEYGVIERQEKRVSWRATDKHEATFHRWENAREGMSYLLVVDPASGDSRTGGKDPDRHSVGVIRKGYHDLEGRWHPPKLACRVRPPNRWDIDVLEEQVWRLALLYGGPDGCAIMVEENKDAGLIELLKLRNAQLLKRKIFNHREGKEMEAIGWNTNEKTRDFVIHKLAKAIREYDQDGDGIEICCEHAVKEIENFIETDSGRAEAAQGCHDDDVLMLAIGLYNIERASLLPKQVRRHRYSNRFHDDESVSSANGL